MGTKILLEKEVEIWKQLLESFLRNAHPVEKKNQSICIYHKLMPLVT